MEGRLEDLRVDRSGDRMEDLTVGRLGDRMEDLRVDRSGGQTVDRSEDLRVGRSGGQKVDRSEDLRVGRLGDPKVDGMVGWPRLEALRVRFVALAPQRFRALKPHAKIGKKVAKHDVNFQ